MFGPFVSQSFTYRAVVVELHLLTARTTDCKQVTCTDSNHITVLSPVSCVLPVQVSIYSRQSFTLSLFTSITWYAGRGSTKTIHNDCLCDPMFSIHYVISMGIQWRLRAKIFYVPSKLAPNCGFSGKVVLNINICFCNPQKAHLCAKIGAQVLANSCYNLVLNATVGYQCIVFYNQITNWPC